MKTLREKLASASVADGKYYMLTVAAPSSGYLLRRMEAYQVTQYLDYRRAVLHARMAGVTGARTASLSPRIVSEKRLSGNSQIFLIFIIDNLNKCIYS
jgi:hypothetical protein